MKSAILLLGLLAASRDGWARATVSSWTGLPSPSIFSSFKFPYKVAMEVEISNRSLRLIADDFDMTPLAPLKDRMERADFTRDYLNATTLAQLWLDNAAMAQQLTDGLDLGRDVRAEILRANAEARKERLAEFRKSLGGGLEIPKPAVDTKLARLETTKMIGVDGLTFPRQGEPSLARNDWQILNGRWNALDPAVRLALVDLRLVSADIKVDLIREIMPGKYSRSTEPEMWSAALEGSRGFWTEFDVSRDGHNVNEFRHHAPWTSASLYLERLAEITQSTNIFGAIKNPSKGSRRDSSYHLNFSVEGRAESLSPVVTAWQKLIVLRLLAAGVLNVFNTMYLGYSIHSDYSGFIRLHQDNYVEVRDHFTDPETELAMLMRVVELPNEQAVRLIHTEYMPKVTPWMLQVLYDQNRNAFLDVVFASPGLEIELPESLKNVAHAKSDAELLLRHVKYRPLLLSNPQRLAEFLGPKEFKKFRRNVKGENRIWTLLESEAAPLARNFIKETRPRPVRRLMKGLTRGYEVVCEALLRASTIAARAYRP